jgi:hypothetical protein
MKPVLMKSSFANNRCAALSAQVIASAEQKLEDRCEASAHAVEDPSGLRRENVSFLYFPNYLCITSTFLSIPILYYIFKTYGVKLSKISVIEFGLASMLFIAMCVSYWFWSNPVKNGISHNIDGIIAKITICVFLFYVLFYKELREEYKYSKSAAPERMRNNFVCIGFILLLVLLVFFALMSHRASSKEWCSSEHLFYHGGMHLVAASSAFYAFI